MTGPNPERGPHLEASERREQGHFVVAQAAQRLGQHAQLLERGARDRQAAQQQRHVRR